MSDTSTVTATEDSLSASSLLSTSLGSISSPRRRHSEFSKVYKQASNFFLTRRFREALSAVRPLLEVPETSEDDGEEFCEVRGAPISKADKKWRIKIWSFYLTLLNTIAELGLEEGRQLFGKQEWRRMVSKAEDGSIWQEVVDVGYGGHESHLDADVVINLANLLLSQATDQKRTQQYLETYLSSADQPKSTSDIKWAESSSFSGIAGSSGRSQETSTLRDLEAHLQIIEIYCLHVLPQNGEWEYAKDFISLSNMLDDERKETFLQTLNELQEEETAGQDNYEDAVPQQDQSFTEVSRSQDIERTDSNITIKPDPPKIHRRFRQENDHGIEATQGTSDSSALKSLPPQPTEEPAPIPVRKPSGTLQARPPQPPPARPARRVPQSSIVNRSVALIRALHKLVSNMTFRMSQNPAVLLRFVLFLMAIVAAFSRRDMRERLRRLTGSGWDKVRRTVGMGVKVSYI